MKNRLELYEFWGVSFTSNVGSEFIATCPFCNHNDKRTGNGHLYVNMSGTFQCKSCSKEGSWRTFLKLIFLQRLEKTTDSDLLRMTEETGIPLPILKLKKIAYDSERKAWLHTIIDHKKEVVDIRLYRKNKKEISTASCGYGLAGFDTLIENQNAEVFICGSFRDKLALEWLLWRNGISEKDQLVVATCSENTFRDELVPHFLRRKAIVCYDNDEAGYGVINYATGKATGSRKIEAILKACGGKTNFVVWPEIAPPGFDIRDFVNREKENPVQALKIFQSYIKVAHKDDLGKVHSVLDSPHTNVEFSKIVEKIREVYEVDNYFIDAVKLAFATTYSINLPGKNNVWLFLVGPPSSGKTIICEFFELSERCLWQSTLSSKSLISHYGQSQGLVDVSILARLDRKALVLKDYTEVLSLPETERRQVEGILRGAYEGRVQHPSGVGERDYICEFSILSGVTAAINSVQTAELGERFMRYKMCSTTNIETIQEAALNAQLFGGQTVEDIKVLTTEFMRNNYNIEPKRLLGMLPTWFRQKVIPLARLITHLQSVVKRFQTGYKAGSVMYKPEIIAPTRLTTQLEKLALALTLIQEEPQVSEDTYRLIRTVAFDTVDGYNTDIVKYLIKNPDKNHNEIKEATGINVNGQLEDLSMVGLIEKSREKRYSVTKRTLDFYNRSRT